MPKAKTSKRTRRVVNRATVFYDNPCEGESIRNITVRRSAGGRVLRTTSIQKTETSINGDSADPWTTGFFDANTETVVVDSDDSPPVCALDELLDSNPLESQPEPKERCIAESPLEAWKVQDRSDGRAGESSCSFCGDRDGLYKCKECFGCRLHCHACVVERHSSHPLHQIEQWNGSFFVRTSLRDLGPSKVDVPCNDR
ncbi:hypothetical protein BGY98DRAFT_1185291 [Russula aff. rugulosa BPL654]|nr:hypothetical protein BGY98DRAFT_1185291 [Russula aff. rugulosa BPL654]